MPRSPVDALTVSFSRHYKYFCLFVEPTKAEACRSALANNHVLKATDLIKLFDRKLEVFLSCLWLSRASNQSSHCTIVCHIGAATLLCSSVALVALMFLGTATVAGGVVW